MHGFSLTIETVVLVGGFGHTDDVGKGSDGFLEGHNRVRFDNFTVSVFLLKIVQANFDVELTTSGNNVLTVLLSCAND